MLIGVGSRSRIRRAKLLIYQAMEGSILGAYLHCDFGAGRGDCSFSSLQQCQATASGRDAYCAENPYFNAKDELQPDRSRQSPRRY